MDEIKIAILIKKLSLEFDKIALPALVPFGLTPTQFKVIKYVLRNRDKIVRQKDIETFYSLTNPTVTGVLQNLEKNDWVKRVKNANDGRSKVIKPTEKTLQQEKNLYALGEELEQKFIHGLDAEEQTQLKALLLKLFQSIKEGN